MTNSQITDSVRLAQTFTVDAAPSQSMAMLDAVMTETLGMGMYNAISTQHNSQLLSNAAVTSTCARLLAIVLGAPPAPPPPAPAITSPATGEGTVDVPFTFVVTATNSPTSYAAASLPAGLAINSSTGVISGTPTATGTFTVGLTATNATGSAVQTFVLTIDPAPVPPSYSGTLSPTWTQGAAYTFTPTFGTVTQPYALTGALPPGLNFIPASGVIAGTPTQAGSFPITLSATNAGGTTNQPLTVVVNSLPAITSASQATAVIGTPFTFTLTSSGTPAATSYTAIGLPAGLSLNATTGVISGTPTVVSPTPANVSVSATNAAGTGPTSTLAITVTAAPAVPVISGASTASGTVGTAFPTYTLMASNSPTSFQASSGTLPAGLTLNSTTGAISGTPTAATAPSNTVSFTATNAAGTSQPFALTITITT